MKKAVTALLSALPSTSLNEDDYHRERDEEVDQCERLLQVLSTVKEELDIDREEFWAVLESVREKEGVIVRGSTVRIALKDTLHRVMRGERKEHALMAGDIYLTILRVDGKFDNFFFHLNILLNETNRHSFHSGAITNKMYTIGMMHAILHVCRTHITSKDPLHAHFVDALASLLTTNQPVVRTICLEDDLLESLLLCVASMVPYTPDHASLAKVLATIAFADVFDRRDVELSKDVLQRKVVRGVMEACVLTKMASSNWLPTLKTILHDLSASKSSNLVLVFSQHLILRHTHANDALRQKLTSLISNLLLDFPFNKRLEGKLSRFLEQCSRNNDSTTTRVISCDLAHRLGGKYVESILVERAHDKNPTVRNASMNGLAEVVAKVGDKEEADFSFLHGVVLERVGDTRATVRRGALKVVGALLERQHMLDEPHRVLFSRLGERTRDESLVIRKMAAKLMGAQLRFFEANPVDNAFVGLAYIEKVLPLACDQEKSVSTLALDSVNTHLLSSSSFPLLSLIKGESLGFLKKALVLLCRLDKVKKPHVLVQHCCQNKNAYASWLLLNLLCSALGRERGPKVQALAAQAVAAVDVDFVLDSHAAISQQGEFVVSSTTTIPSTQILSASPSTQNNPTTQQVDSTLQNQNFLLNKWTMSVMESTAHRLPPSTKSPLASSTFARLMNFQVCETAIHQTLRTYVALLPDLATTKQRASQLLDATTQECRAFVMSTEASSKESQDRVTRALFLAGEVCLLGFTPEMTLRGGWVSVNEEVVMLTQALVSPTLRLEMTGNEEPVAVRIRAHAILVLGKVCLRDEAVAKRSAALFVQELSESPQAVVKSNILVVLGDLCRQYTSLIDVHVDKLSTCLGDAHALVRRQALVLLTGLLQGDYIKFKNGLFFHFLGCCEDPDVEIAKLARYGLCKVLLHKNPGLFETNLVDALFVLTDFKGHRKYNAHAYMACGGPVIRRLLTPDQHPARLRLYALMLLHMSPKAKLEVLAKVCNDVFAGMVDGRVPMPSKGEDSMLFQDCVAMLCSPEITLSPPKAQEDATLTKAAAVHHAKLNVMLALEKKYTFENMVPTVIALYRCLQQRHSKCTQYIRYYMGILMKAHPKEIKDALVGNDRDLMKEVEYDLREIKSVLEQEAVQTQGNEESSNIELLRKTPMKARLESTAKKRRLSVQLMGQSARKLAMQGTPISMSKVPMTARKSGKFGSGTKSRGGVLSSGVKSSEIKSSTKKSTPKSTTLRMVNTPLVSKENSKTPRQAIKRVVEFNRDSTPPLKKAKVEIEVISRKVMF